METSKLAVGALKRLPKNAVSRAFGAISEVEFPAPMQRVVNRSFAHLTGVDTEEAARPPEGYATLNDYFTRRLRKGARDVQTDTQGALVSPVDGKLGAFGPIEEGTLYQAKGREYRLVDLVDSAAAAEWFEGGWYATVYLSPRDYHRIHSPVGGQVEHIGYIPGQLFPVNPFAVENIDELFAINERLITYLQTERLGRVAVVKVGATCVGRISLTFHDMKTNGSFRRRQEFDLDEPVSLSHGDELAVFNLGSTVIVLVENEEFRFREGMETGDVLRVGEWVGGREVVGS